MFYECSSLKKVSDININIDYDYTNICFVFYNCSDEVKNKIKLNNH